MYPPFLSSYGAFFVTKYLFGYNDGKFCIFININVENMDLKKLLSSSSYTVINKHLMKKIGLEETFMLQYLLDLQENCFNGEFFQQQSRLSEEFGWTLHRIKTTMASLKNMELINVIKKGIPARNFFVINESKVIEILSDQSVQNKPTSGQNAKIVNMEPSSELKISRLDSSNEAHIKQNKEEQNKKKKINNIDNIDRQYTDEELDIVFSNCI